jgi:hypothetical protein
MMSGQDFETTMAEMKAQLVKLERRVDRMNAISPTFLLLMMSALCFGAGVAFVRGESMWAFVPGFIGVGAGWAMTQYSIFRHVKYLRARTELVKVR